jgi:alanine racemase
MQVRFLPGAPVCYSTHMKQLPLSYIELSKRNLEHNLKSLRALAKPGTKFALAIKGNAYGHGQNEIAKLAEKFADYFIVNSLEELRELRKVSNKPTFVLGYVAPSALGEALPLKPILSVFSETQLGEVEKAAKKAKLVQEVHIAVDALLGREGFLEADLSKLFAAAKRAKHVRITGIYAHFANIEDTNNFTHAERQIAAYKNMLAIAAKHGYAHLETHIAATSGLLAYEKDRGEHTIVRIGIGMYGLWPSEHLEYAYRKGTLDLQPVLSWKTHIAQIKTLPAGRTIGYGLTYMTKKPTKIALIPQGYADGYPRLLSNKGEVLIGGKRCRVLGRVSMNMFVVDATSARGAKEGDEVVLLGPQGKDRITAEELGEWEGTINYEATTRISSLLPRIVR